jgi:hypothetical protein
VHGGFTPALRESVFKQFRGLETKRCPFRNLPESLRGQWGEGLTAADMEKCRYLKPRLVCDDRVSGMDSRESSATRCVHRAKKTPADGKRYVMVQEQPAMVVILTCGYRAKCVAPGCGNVARAILRYTAAEGRPLRQEESCIAHTAEARNAAVANGVKIHDNRKS